MIDFEMLAKLMSFEDEVAVKKAELKSRLEIAVLSLASTRHAVEGMCSEDEIKRTKQDLGVSDSMVAPSPQG